MLFYFLFNKYFLSLHLNSKVCKPLRVLCLYEGWSPTQKGQCCSYIMYTQVRLMHAKWTLIIALNKVVPFLPCIYISTLIHHFRGNKARLIKCNGEKNPTWCCVNASFRNHREFIIPFMWGPWREHLSFDLIRHHCGGFKVSW